jgi:RNA recognition motif-containing protein
MYDPSTGISRGYGFVRFADENDMHRALTLGQNPGSGLSLHGRTLRISEASGPGNALDGNGRARSRNGDPLMIQTGGYQQQQYQPQHQQHQQYQQQHQQHPQQHQQDYNNSPMNSYAPSFGSQYGQMSPNVMRSPPAIGGYAYQQQQQLQQQQAPQHHTTDPNNTTVFVGGLPACISEETLKVCYRLRQHN